MKIVECPRDALQGLERFVPTELKIEYLNALLAVGFDALDFGSFVSEKAVPQMRDTAEVLTRLDLDSTHTQLLAIVANLRGAQEAVMFEAIHFLGFPFSVSETFQLKNTNATIRESLVRVKEIQELCVKYNKQLIVYLSMAFGNPYNDPWDAEIVTYWANELHS
ncbi:MAG: hydroxymethylglutaryl-CoA lyase, partial [Bacteroidia bacterium]|nr:hydroxymethylglutaryl-CoA lyase [Bacteroidia bacterium]